ncbi:type II toxin-antitoxin system VapC family toxin [Pseudonocardia nigra]|uniref:type II toxin-antitoxin system VapC family toxin n=1 Tax=Pseudonocardia nigra TaxID=1921578 RepID=UPI001C5F5F02|nr:PIN domain nuclease [Pseudonocardia nigra]
MKPDFAVDTSVWIDFLADRSTPQVEYLDKALRDARQIAMTDIVLTEILQGLRESAVKRVEFRLAVFPVLQLRGLGDFRRSASIYRASRARGVTIRRTTDCLIAAVCIREGVPLLHDDRGFDAIAAVSELSVVPVS